MMAQQNFPKKKMRKHIKKKIVILLKIILIILNQNNRIIKKYINFNNKWDKITYFKLMRSLMKVFIKISENKNIYN